MGMYWFDTHEKLVALMVALVATGPITNLGEGIIPAAVADSEQLWMWLLLSTFGMTYGAIKLLQRRVRRSEERRLQRHSPRCPAALKEGRWPEEARDDRRGRAGRADRAAAEGGVMNTKWQAVALAVGLTLTTAAATTAHDAAGREPVARAGFGEALFVLPLQGEYGVRFVPDCVEQAADEFTAIIENSERRMPLSAGDQETVVFEPGPYIVSIEVDDVSCTWALFIEPV